MEDGHNPIKLTAAELSYTWSTYLADSMSVCVFTHFLEHVEDKEIKKLIQFAMNLSQQHLEGIRGIYKQEEIHIPQGFTKEDVNVNASRLFTDVFFLIYVKNMAKGGLATYSRVTQNIYRDDVRSFFESALISTIELDSIATRLLLEKGLASRPPSIPYPQKVEFVEKQSFILEGLGRRNTLTGTEVTNLFANIQTNQLGVALATAFSQVAQSKKVQHYFLRGKEIALKHIKVLGSYLEMNSLPVPSSLEQEISVSTDPPFSDKLMMFHFNLMIYAGVGNFGISISESQRSDLVVDYSRLNAEILKYSEDGGNLMIANKWYEQPPLSIDRKNLARGE